MSMDEDERLNLLGCKDSRAKKDKKKKKKKEKTMEEKEKETIELSRESVKRLKEEIDVMRQTIEKLSAEASGSGVSTPAPKYALDFDPKEYLAMGFLESANWIGDKIAVTMKERMEKMEGRWEVFKMLKPPDLRSMRTCATFNRGENCRQGKWHTVQKKIPMVDRIAGAQVPHMQRSNLNQGNAYRDELRVHACTLCVKALGVLCMHSVLDCPWTLEENWK